jgi:pSer/pThr/pTyr-binding forkhead associated (FHA) protein
MIICRSCQKSQPEGAIFCSECGTKLSDTAGLTTQTIDSAADLLQTSAFEEDVYPEQSEQTGQRVSLHILKSGERIALVGQDDFTIGRMSEGQSIIPDIDLSPYNAYQEGVSRIHASVKVADNRVQLIDLSSVNGTAINETKIPPNQYHALQDGDVITLGRLKVQVVILA